MRESDDNDAPGYRPDTQYVHAGQGIDPISGSVGVPIQPGTTFQRDPDGGYARGFIYSRQANPTRSALETALATLEGGGQAFAFASGSAATQAVLQTLRPGAHVLLSEDCYHGTRYQLLHLFADWGIHTTQVDTTRLEAVEAARRPETRLLWIESPSNPQLRISDLEALAVWAGDHGILSVCDNTVATPVLQRPLEHGIDLVVHSTTKFLGGHGDLLGGAVIARPGLAAADTLRQIQGAGGAVPSPFDCWLLLRSLRTLGVRVRRQTQTAAILAQRLGEHPQVARVFHPLAADVDDPERVRRYLPDGCGLLSFCVDGDQAQAMRTVAAARLFTRATSLGSVESLIEHRASIEGPESRTPESLIRLSIGLEAVEDLWQDLDRALTIGRAEPARG